MSKVKQLMVESDRCQFQHKEVGRGQPFSMAAAVEWHSFIVKSKDIVLVLQFEHTAPAFSGIVYLVAIADISTTVMFRAQIQ